MQCHKKQRHITVFCKFGGWAILDLIKSMCSTSMELYTNMTHMQCRPRECHLMSILLVWWIYLINWDVLISSAGTDLVLNDLNDPQTWKVSQLWALPTHVPNCRTIYSRLFELSLSQHYTAGGGRLQHETIISPNPKDTGDIMDWCLLSFVHGMMSNIGLVTRANIRSDWLLLIDYFFRHIFIEDIIFV